MPAFSVSPVGKIKKLRFIYYNMLKQVVNLIFGDKMGPRIGVYVGDLTDSEIVHLSDMKTRRHSDFLKKLCGYN